MSQTASPTPGLWRRWKDLLAHKEPAHGLAILRIGLGLILLLELISVILNGLVPMLWMHTDHGGYRAYTLTGAWLIDLLGGPAPSLIWTLVALGLLSGVGILLGVGTRVAALVGLQSFLALAWTNGHAGGSYDTLITNLLWLLVLADSGSTGSLTAKLRTGRWWPSVEVSAWPRYLVVGQMVTVYAATGLQKVSASWVPGGDLSALYYILQQPSWHRYDLSWVASVYPLTQLLTLSSWLFEVASPVLLFALWGRASRSSAGPLRRFSNRVDLRKWWLGFGLLMHIGIMILMDVGTFSLACVSTYACFFHADELKAAGRVVSSRLGRTAASPPERPCPPAE